MLEDTFGRELCVRAAVLIQAIAAREQGEIGGR